MPPGIEILIILMQVRDTVLDKQGKQNWKCKKITGFKEILELWKKKVEEDNCFIGDCDSTKDKNADSIDIEYFIEYYRVVCNIKDNIVRNFYYTGICHESQSNDHPTPFESE